MSELRVPGPEKLMCGWCGDWLRLEDIEGHLNSEGRTLMAPAMRQAAYDAMGTIRPFPDDDDYALADAIVEALLR